MKGKVISLLMVGLFIGGFFLGSINYDLNPKDIDKTYRSLTFIEGSERVDIGNESLGIGDEENYFNFRWIKFSNLNRKTNYLITVSLHGGIDQYIDTYLVFFTNTTIYEMPLAIAKRSVNFFRIENNNFTLGYYNRTIQIIFYEELTPVDIVKLIPIITDLNLFATLSGVIIGVIMSYISVNYRKYIDSQLNKVKDHFKKVEEK